MEKNKLLDITDFLFFFLFFFFFIITDFIISDCILFILHNQWKFILEGLLYAS